MGIEKVSISQAITAARVHLDSQIQGAQEVSAADAGIAEKSRAPGQLRNGPAVPTEKERIEKASTDFEALLLQQMLKSMWTSMASEGEGLFSSGQEHEFYRDILNERVAQDVAEKQSLGIKQIVAADMWKQASRRKPGNSGSSEGGEL